MTWQNEPLCRPEERRVVNSRVPWQWRILLVTLTQEHDVETSVRSSFNSCLALSESHQNVCAFLQTPQPSANSSPVAGCFTCSGHSSPSSWTDLRNGNTYMNFWWIVSHPVVHVHWLLFTWLQLGIVAGRSWADSQPAGSRRGRHCRSEWCQSRKRRRQSSNTGTCTPGNRCRVWGTSTGEKIWMNSMTRQDSVKILEWDTFL